jgi:Delta7-sterol 5-desaturase
MSEYINFSDLRYVWLINLGILLTRYFLFAGLAFLFIWKIFKNKLIHLRIQENFPSSQKIRNEIFYSISTLMIFAFEGVFVFYLNSNGYTQIYKNFSQYGMMYFVFFSFSFDFNS